MAETPQPKEWIRGIAPYVPGRAARDDGVKLVKLSANENPLGCSAKATTALRDAAGDVTLYPDPGATRLREAIGATHGLNPAQIICGSGSDDILHLAANAFAGPGDEVIYVRYGFSVYDIAARRYGATPVIAADVDFGSDVDAITACLTDATRIVFIANPNNPTGTFMPRAEVEQLHAALPSHVLLVMDGAYGEYLDEDEDDGALTLAQSHENVLVTRTFSKIYGLAAERIGWGFGAPALIETLHRIRLPFNVTTAGQQAAIAALADQDFVAASRTHNRQWREWLTGELNALGNHGVRVVPSKANFVLALFEGAVSAETVHEGLMARGLAVRWLPGQGLPHALRITIGTQEQTRAVADGVRAILEGGD